MKKIILIILTVTGINFTGTAQEFGFQKGNVLVEGTLQASSQEGGMENYEKQSSFGFEPKVSYFLTDKWAVGLTAGIGNSKYEPKEGASELQMDSKYNTVGVFGRYYFLDIGSRFKTFAELNADLRNVKLENNSDYDIEIGDIREYHVRGGIGANFFLTKNISIAYTLTNLFGYRSSKWDSPVDVSTQYFHMNVNTFQNIFDNGTFSLAFKF